MKDAVKRELNKLASVCGWTVIVVFALSVLIGLPYALLEDRAFREVMKQQQFPDGLSPRGFWGSERSEEGFARTMGLVRLALS